MRSIWKGSISFGLVTIPVALYSATRREELKFRLLRSSDLSPINYKRVAEADGLEVPWDQIVKGYEFEKGRFVVLRDEDFHRVDIEAAQSVDIIDFVELGEVDPIHFYKPYYLEPQRGGEKAYALLRDALDQTGKAGIAKVVIKSRLHLAAVRAHHKGLLLELMHFAGEILPVEDLKIPEKSEAGKRELEMAKSLVESMTEPWQPQKYKDDYREGLLRVIEEKIESGGELPPLPKPKRGATNVIDLVDVLQKSLEGARQREKKASRPRRVATGKRRKKTA